MSSNDGKIEPLEGVVQINNKIAQRENVKIVVQVKSNSWIHSMTTSLITWLVLSTSQTSPKVCL